MMRVIVYCEGQTEETFVNRLLVPYLASKDIFLIASTKGPGGVSKYSKIRNAVKNWCRQDDSWYVTTMLDYYALPSDTPGKKDAQDLSALDRVKFIENEVYKDVGEVNFIPNLILHEFEMLLFCDVDSFKVIGLSEKELKKLSSIRESVVSPEEINNRYETSPAHRILNIIPDYSKVLDGYNIAKNIDIDNMRRQCHHFDEWISAIERLG